MPTPRLRLPSAERSSSLAQRYGSTGHGEGGQGSSTAGEGKPPDTIPGKGLGGRDPGAAPRPPALGTGRA